MVPEQNLRREEEVQVTHTSRYNRISRERERQQYFQDTGRLEKMVLCAQRVNSHEYCIFLSQNMKKAFSHFALQWIYTLTK